MFLSLVKEASQLLYLLVFLVFHDKRFPVYFSWKHLFSAAHSVLNGRLKWNCQGPADSSRRKTSTCSLSICKSDLPITVAAWKGGERDGSKYGFRVKKKYCAILSQFLKKQSLKTRNCNDKIIANIISYDLAYRIKH